MSFTLLYIDPGTGSAIFSIVIGLAAAVFFFAQTLIVKFKMFISGGKAKLGAKNKYVIYAEDKRYWTLFKPIVEEFENRKTDLLYLTASKDDPVFDAGFQHIKAEYLGEGNKAFARLNFLSADIVLSTTPGLDVYQWKRSKTVKHYCHIYHTTGMSVMYELYGMDYYDSVLVTGSEYQENHIRKLEKIRNLPEKHVVTVGCPYLDEYAKKINEIPDKDNKLFTVLVSPSWGKAALLSMFGEKLLDPLIKTGWKIIVRPHPQSLKVEKELIDKLSGKYSENSNLQWDFERENIYSLKEADVMISDYSGIILDYMFLRNKTVFYLQKIQDWRTRDAFEIYTDEDEIWNRRILKETGTALKRNMLNKLPDMITEAVKNTNLENNIIEAKGKAWNYQGEAGKRVVDFMVGTVESDMEAV